MDDVVLRLRFVRTTYCGCIIKCESNVDDESFFLFDVKRIV